MFGMMTSTAVGRKNVVPGDNWRKEGVKPATATQIGVKVRNRKAPSANICKMQKLALIPLFDLLNSVMVTLKQENLMLGYFTNEHKPAAS